MKRNGDQNTYVVTGVCCATEEKVLRKRLDRELGTGGYQFNPATCELRVHHAATRDEIVQAVREAGFGVRERMAARSREPFLRRHRQAIHIALAAVLGFVGATLLENGARTPGQVVLLAAMAVGGWEIVLKAFRAVRQGVIDTNVLMTTAMAGAIVVNKWEEAVAVIILYSFSMVLETYASARTRRAVESLVSLSPTDALVVRDGKEETVKAELVRPGDVVSIRPGMRIPLDGVVVEGESTVSEAMLTGEPLPVEKSPGSDVYAGCMNERGALRVRVSRAFEDTRLAHIIHLVEEAQQQKAPIQTSMDRFASRYTVFVLLGALALAAIPPLAFGEPFKVWFYRALIMLVIACPCALVISTPVTFVSALTAAARRGILVKGGKYFEMLARVKTIAFDKTGTLTEGRLQMTDIVPLNGMKPAELLSLVAAIEARSEHQLGSAIVREAALWNVEQSNVQIGRFEALPGRGVKALVDGTQYYLGNRALAIEQRFDTAELGDLIRRFEIDGKTTLTIGKPGEVLGVLALRDSARHESRQLVGELKRNGIREIVLLSGDASESSKRLSEEIGLTSWTGAMMPEDKVRAIEQLRLRAGDVAMVGDGINDTPALAAASVGIAMGGSGSDAALETADVVLMGDDLLSLPPLFSLSRKTVRLIRQNIVFALGIKLLFVLLSATGIATLWLALLADDGAALIVILNGMRVLSGFRKGE